MTRKEKVGTIVNGKAKDDGWKKKSRMVVDEKVENDIWRES